MPGYFRNLSTFRVLVLLLLVLSLGLLVYELSSRAPRQDGQTRGSGTLWREFSVASDHFARRLVAMEGVAVQLSPLYGRDDTLPEDALYRILNASEPFIQGVALKTAVGVSTLSRTREDSRWQFALPFDGDEQPSDTAHAWRTMWGVASESPEDATGELRMTLAVPIFRSGVARETFVLVSADLRWLADILLRLASAGAKRTLCIAPDGEIIWFDNGILYHCPITGVLPIDDWPGYVRAGETVRDTVDDPRYARVDILGSGWILAAETPRIGSGVMTLAIVTGLIALSAVCIEGTLAAMNNVGAVHRPDRIDSLAAMRDLPPRNGGKPRGALASLHNLLFKYRITNPEQERLDSELVVARQIQFSLVPDKFQPYSKWREYDLYSLLSPAKEVGGDYYDFFRMGPNRIVVAVGDVSGKGMPAALYMAVCRTAFRTLAWQSDNPGELLTRLNDMLVHDNTSGLYVTLACFFVDLPTGKCEYSIAGHPAPLWRRAKTRDGELLDSPRETFIGMKPAVTFPVGRIRLRPGDTLLLYTDGVTESRNAAGEDLEYAGLHDMFAESVNRESCREVIEELDARVRAFSGDSEQVDDITLLALRYWGAGGRTLSDGRLNGGSFRSVADGDVSFGEG